MGYGRLVFAIIGFSTSFVVCMPNLKRWLRQKMAQQNLRLIRKALEQAEETVLKFQERHDRILTQTCSYYMVNEELLKALVGARDAMDAALAYAVALRDMELKILTSLPGHHGDAFMLDNSST